MKINWKIVFGLYFIISIVIFWGLIIYQDFKNANSETLYEVLESDIYTISEIFNKTDFSRKQIEEVLHNQYLYYYKK